MVRFGTSIASLGIEDGLSDGSALSVGVALGTPDGLSDGLADGLALTVGLPLGESDGAADSACSCRDRWKEFHNNSFFSLSVPSERPRLLFAKSSANGPFRIKSAADK